MDTATNPYAAPTTESYPAAPTNERLGQQLRWTSLGLQLISIGTLIVSVAGLTALVAVLVGRDISPPTIVMGSIATVGMLILGVGPVLCLSAPHGYGLRFFAFSTVVSEAIGFGAFVVSFVMPGILVIIGVFFVALIAASLFLMFIHRLATCLKRRDLIRQTRRVEYLWMVVVFGTIPAIVFQRSIPTALGISLTVVYFFLLAICLIAYALLASAMANAIGQVMPPAGSK